MLGAFGVIYQVMLIALLFGAIRATEINSYFLGVSGLLLIVIIAMAFNFRAAMSSAAVQ